MNAEGYAVAVLGAASELGQELRSVLRERRLSVREWRLYGEIDLDDVDDDGEEVFANEQIDLAGIDVVFLCGTEAEAREWIPRAVEEGALAIDLTQASAEDPDVPLVVPEVNPEEIDRGLDRRAIASPAPGAIALSVALSPLREHADLRRVVVASYEPVSTAGRAGVEELARQSADLLSGRSTDAVVFPHRIAFNVVPQVGAFVGAGRTRGEWQIEAQTRRVLALSDLPMAVTAVHVPVFYGYGYAVHVETENPLDAGRAAALLREARGILLLDQIEGDLLPTLAEVGDSEATYVGRVRDDPSVPHGISLWVAIDGLRKGGAVNAVQIAERALRAPW